MTIKLVLMRVGALICIAAGGLIAYFAFDLFLVIALILGGTLIFLLSFFERKPPSNITVQNFINVFTHFRVTLDSDANVFQALTATLSVTSGRLYETLETLIQALEVNHTVTPFIAFARPFKHRFVTHIMINVFMLINHGVDQKRLWQFNYMFETLVKEYNEELYVRHASSYERFDILVFLGSGIIIFTLIVSVLGMIGGI